MLAPPGAEQAPFHHNPGSTGHTATHAAISVNIDGDQTTCELIGPIGPVRAHNVPLGTKPLGQGSTVAGSAS